MESEMSTSDNSQMGTWDHELKTIPVSTIKDPHTPRNLEALYAHDTPLKLEYNMVLKYKMTTTYRTHIFRDPFERYNTFIAL